MCCRATSRRSCGRRGGGTSLTACASWSAPATAATTRPPTPQASPCLQRFGASVGPVMIVSKAPSQRPSSWFCMVPRGRRLQPRPRRGHQYHRCLRGCTLFLSTFTSTADVSSGLISRCVGSSVCVQALQRYAAAPAAKPLYVEMPGCIKDSTTAPAGDLIYTSMPARVGDSGAAAEVPSSCQYFWEAFPSGSGPADRCRCN